MLLKAFDYMHAHWLLSRSMVFIDVACLPQILVVRLTSAFPRLAKVYSNSLQQKSSAPANT